MPYTGRPSAECDAREHVAERNSQCQTKDDGDHARGGDQRADRHAENEGEDRQTSAEIDDNTHDEVLQKTGLLGPALEDEVDAHEADDRRDAETSNTDQNSFGGYDE